MDTYYRINDTYNIDTLSKLESLIDGDGNIKQDIAIRGDEIKSLGSLKKVYGTLGIDSLSLQDLGQLEYIQNDLWILKSSSNLNSLGQLKTVGGDVSIRYSKIMNLGNLERIEGRFSLRDTEVQDLGLLKYVGGNLLLPNRFKDVNIDFVEVKGKMKFWRNEGTNTPIVKPIRRVKIDLGHWIVFLTIPFKFSFIHAQELAHKSRVLNGQILVHNFNLISELNEYVQRNIEDYYVFIDYKLEALYGGRYSFYESIFGSIKTVDEINSEFINKSKPLPTAYKEAKSKCCKSKKSIWLSYDENSRGFADRSGRNMRKKPFVYYVENTFYEIFSSMILDSQNEFRVSKGIPKIGEGWVSETELFYLLKYKFSEHEVIHHGKPSWLGRQHVDIWFPKFKIGIEYQGLQHDEPIEFFGGKESFLKNQERDKKKKFLFESNGATLIEIRKGYNIKLIYKKLDGLMNK